MLTQLRLLGAEKVATEFYQPLDTGGWFFVAPRLEYQSESLDVTYLGAVGWIGVFGSSWRAWPLACSFPIGENGE